MPGTTIKTTAKTRKGREVLEPTKNPDFIVEDEVKSIKSFDLTKLREVLDKIDLKDLSDKYQPKKPNPSDLILQKDFESRKFKEPIKKFRDPVYEELISDITIENLNINPDQIIFKNNLSKSSEFPNLIEDFYRGVTGLFSREQKIVEAVRNLPQDHALRAFIILDALTLPEAINLTLTADLAFGPKALRGIEFTSKLLAERISRNGSAAPGPFDKLFTGSITVASPIEHSQKARRNRRQMLLGTPEFAAIMTMIRGDRELQREIAPFLQRSADYHNGRVDPEAARLGMSKNMQRQAIHTTALFAGLVNSPRLNWVLQRGIDRKVESDSNLFWNRLRGSEVVYLPEFVTGSGVHAANYVSTRYMMVPDKMGIVAERRSRIGGEFWLAPAGLWNMNSETNRFGDGVGLAPGGYGALNSMGPMAPVQQADLEGAVYGSNSKVGAAARINIVNSALSISNADTVAVYRNNELARAILPEQIIKNAPTDAIILELRNPKTFERGFVVTNRHIYSGGLGKTNEGFDLTDQTTAEILAEEYAKAARGEKAQLYSFDGLTERLGDPSQPHPLEGIDEAVLLGGGDGQRIKLEALRGHFKLGRTTKQLDSIDTITIFGAEYGNRDEFLEKVRPRYSAAAIELSGDIEDFRHSTELSKLRAFRLRQNKNGKIVLILKNPDTGEISEFTPSGKNPIIANLTGFKVDGLQIFESLGRKFYTPSQALEAAEKLLKEGTIIRYEPKITNLLGTSALVDQTKILRIEQTANTTDIIAEETTTEGLRVPKTYVFYDLDLRKVARKFFDSSANLMISEPVRTVDTNKIVYAHTYGVEEQDVSQLTPVARQIDGLEIYAIGPTAKLPLTPAAKRLIDLLGVSENTVAMWVYQRGVTLAGVYFAQKDKEGKFGAPINSIAIKSQDLPTAKPSTRGQVAIINFKPEYVQSKLPFDMNRNDLMRLAACVNIGESRVPKSLKADSITFKVELITEPGDAARLKYRVIFPIGFPKDVKYRGIVTSLLSDPDIQFGIHERLVPPKTGMASDIDRGRIGLKIEIPIGKKGIQRRLQPERMIINDYDLD